MSRRTGSDECCGKNLQIDACQGLVVVFSLFVLDEVDEEVHRAVEGGEEVTEAGDGLHPFWPVLHLTD